MATTLHGSLAFIPASFVYYPMVSKSLTEVRYYALLPFTAADRTKRNIAIGPLEFRIYTLVPMARAAKFQRWLYLKICRQVSAAAHLFTPNERIRIKQGTIPGFRPTYIKYLRMTADVINKDRRALFSVACYSTVVMRIICLVLEHGAWDVTARNCVPYPIFKSEYDVTVFKFLQPDAFTTNIFELAKEATGLKCGGQECATFEGTFVSRDVYVALNADKERDDVLAISPRDIQVTRSSVLLHPPTIQPPKKVPKRKRDDDAPLREKGQPELKFDN